MMKVVQKNKNFNSIFTKDTIKQIGFVPTMGALHEGHISLIDIARKQNDIIIVSIFVNPLQFNNKNDLIKYPNTIDKDIELLEKHGCDYLYLPSEQDIYPSNNNYHSINIDLNGLDTIMEGKYRPSHFQGVAVVVKRLFEIIKPKNVYFGEKDFQQLAIIKHLVNSLKIPINIIPCPTIRENNGLAMSSRNMRLSENEKNIASNIYKILSEAKNKYQHSSINSINEFVIKSFKEIKEIELEYFEIIDAKTLEFVKNKKSYSEIIACIAVYIKNVRLIDNITF